MNVKRILIVEDEHPIREMLGFALSDTGFETDEAIDAQQAQATITERRPDLILLDWMLPGQSGLDYARHLRRDNLTREIPIIMLTARAEEQNCIRALKSGVDDYVTKPFSPRELIARVEERTVDVHIRRLRKALKPQGYDGLIQTVRSAGYRFSTHC